jgi:hypothetical protein
VNPQGILAADAFSINILQRLEPPGFLQPTGQKLDNVAFGIWRLLAPKGKHAAMASHAILSVKADVEKKPSREGGSVCLVTS